MFGGCRFSMSRNACRGAKRDAFSLVVRGETTPAGSCVTTPAGLEAKPFIRLRGMTPREILAHAIRFANWQTKPYTHSTKTHTFYICDESRSGFRIYSREWMADAGWRFPDAFPNNHISSVVHNESIGVYTFVWPICCRCLLPGAG